MFYYFNAETKFKDTAPIYGASWDGSSSSAWTRTDAAAGFSNPNPAVNNGTGSSPFDLIMHWAGMTVTENENAGSLVSIPKFYFKLSYANPASEIKGLKIQISSSWHDGFQCSPAHMDRGDGAGERDVIYVGKYVCASDYKSKTGVLPKGNETKSTFRSGIHNLGSKIWQWDYATLLTIQMLYLVEFANWNSQACIGYGCSNSASLENTGITDAMQYHTGTNASSRTTYGHIKYRNIEDLWVNGMSFIDGIYFSSTNIYIIKNPTNFADSSNGTLVGTRPDKSGYTTAYSISTTRGYTWFMYPSAVGGSDSTYICDDSYYNRDSYVLRQGGGYSQNQQTGLFRLYGDANSSSKGAALISRLMYLP